MSGRPVEVARHLRDRKPQRALMQFFKPENWFEARSRSTTVTPPRSPRSCPDASPRSGTLRGRWRKPTPDGYWLSLEGFSLEFRL
jgi:hypothetical protein